MSSLRRSVKPEDREIETGLRHRTTGKVYQPNSKSVPFPNQETIRRRRERHGLLLSLDVPKIQWDCSPYFPYGY